MKPEEPEIKLKEGKDFLNLAEKYSSTGEIERAIEICLEGEELFPDHTSLKFMRGKLLYQAKKYSEARKIIELVLKRMPDYAPAYKILGDIFIQEKNWDEAKNNLQKALFLDPWDKSVQERLESIEKIKKEIKDGDVFLTPTMAELHVNQGLILEAVNIYRKLYKTKKSRKYLSRIKELENSPLYKKNILENQILVLNNWLKAISNLKKINEC